MKISVIFITTIQFSLAQVSSHEKIVDLDKNEILHQKLKYLNDKKDFRTQQKIKGNEDNSFINNDSKFTGQILQNSQRKFNLVQQASKIDENIFNLLQEDPPQPDPPQPDPPQPDPPQPNPPIQPKRLCSQFLSSYVNKDSNYISSCFIRNSPTNIICAACSLQFKITQLKGEYYYADGSRYYQNLIGLIGDYTTGFFLYLVGMYLISKKKFNRYPYRLYAMALLSQAVSSFNFVNIQFFIHPILYKIVAYTIRLSPVKYLQFDDEDQLYVLDSKNFLFQNITYQQQYKAFLFLVAVWKFITIVFQQISLAINVCIYFDTYKILSNPFQPARKRKKYYILYVFIIIIITIIILFRDFFDWKSMSLVAFIPQKKQNPSEVTVPNGNIINWFAVLIIIQLSIIVLCFLRTLCILCRAGTSQSAKKRAIRFHCYYLFILFFSEVLNIQITFTDHWHDQYEKILFDCRDDENQNSICNEYKRFTWLILVRYIGIVQGILRLTEPFVFQEFIKDLNHTQNKFIMAFTSCFKKICCCEHKKEDEVQQDKIKVQKEKILNFQLNQSQSLEISQQLTSPIHTAQLTRTLSIPKKKNLLKNQNSEKGKRKQKHLVQETINGFLNTAMNIEFVYTILLGINTFMECQIQSQHEQQALLENYQNEQNPNQQSQMQATQKTLSDPKKEQMKKTDENLYISQSTNLKKIGTNANYQIKQKDQAIKIKIMDVTMYDAQKFDVDQNFSENTDSMLDQAFNQDYRLKDSPLRGKDKFDFPQDPIIFDESLTKQNFDQFKLIKSSSNANQISILPTAKFGSDQKPQDKKIVKDTPAFRTALPMQYLKEPKSENLQLPQDNSFASSKQKSKLSIEDLNKISFDTEDLSNSKNQETLKRQLTDRSDFSNKKQETESLRQTMSVLGQTLQINYGDQNDEQSATQSFSIQSNPFKKQKKQNIIARILQLESRESYRLKDSDFAEDIVFDPVEVTMKSGHNREVSLALRFMRPEVQKKESFYMPKVISVESRTNNQKKKQKDRNLSRHGRKSIQDKFFHEQNFVSEEKQTITRNQSVFKRQLSNRSLGHGQLSQNYLQTDSTSSSQLFDHSKLKGSQTKSVKEKTKISINLKTEIECLEPLKFAKIMEMDGINPQDVIKSLSIEANHKQLFKAGEGSGQSGSFFFFSWDKKLLIKTLRGKEKKNLLNMLDKMIEYFEKVNNRSLLARIYGCFTIKSNYFPDLDVIVMQNATQLIAPNLSDIINFDLKGSTKGRKTRIQKEQEKFWKQKMNFKGTLKDLNLVEIMHDKGSAVIEITESQFDSFEFIIRRDSQFLRNHNLMDYSLLLTLEQLPCTKEQYDEQQIQFLEKKNQKLNKIMPNQRLSDVIPANPSLLNNHNVIQVSNQNRKTQGQQTSIKDLLKASSIANLQEQSLRLHKDYFHTYDNRSSLQSLDMNIRSNCKTKNSITSKENNKSEYASELESMRQEYKENAQFRNFLKTYIIKEKVMKKEDMRKSHFIKNNQSLRDRIDKSQREDTFRFKKSQPDQKKKKTQKKLGESYRSQDEEDEVEYKYYRQVAHLAIIDYLQEWSMMKKMENAFMRFTLSKQQINTISAVHPELYQSRFENFMVQQFLKPGKEKFMSQEQKNYSETCDEFIMKLAYDIRMSELEIEQRKGLNFIIRQDDQQLKIGGEINQDGQSKDNENDVSYEIMQQQRNLSQTQQQDVLMRQSEELMFGNSSKTPLSSKQTFDQNKSDQLRNQQTFSYKQNKIEDALSDDGQQN